jgi:hypothetical protein
VHHCPLSHRSRALKVNPHRRMASPWRHPASSKIWRRSVM